MRPVSTLAAAALVATVATAQSISATSTSSPTAATSGANSENSAAPSSSSTAARPRYSLATKYSGQTFFDGWAYYGHYDNLTNGDVNFVNRSTTPQLTYINLAGNAIIKVDNESVVPYNEKRNTVRITTEQTYGIGSLWVMDALHVPYGCSVWPAFWSHAPVWPSGGEIDTFEGVNLVTRNQMALHTRAGCTAAPSSSSLTGNLTYGNCDANVNSNSGCTVVESNPQSYGQPFAAAGGGVWVTQLAESGISIWFFSRADVPADLDIAQNSSAVPDPSTWGTPSAFYPSSSCDIGSFFEPQQLTFTITLCGDWAGQPAVFNQTCEGRCYVDYVLNASNYDQAYFEVQHVSVFTDGTATSAASGNGTSSADQSTTSNSPSGSSSLVISSSLAGLVALALGLWAAF